MAAIAFRVVTIGSGAGVVCCWLWAAGTPVLPAPEPADVLIIGPAVEVLLDSTVMLLLWLVTALLLGWGANTWPGVLAGNWGAPVRWWGVSSWLEVIVVGAGVEKAVTMLVVVIVLGMQLDAGDNLRLDMGVRYSWDVIVLPKLHFRPVGFEWRSPQFVHNRRYSRCGMRQGFQPNPT